MGGWSRGDHLIFVDGNGRESGSQVLIKWNSSGMLSMLIDGTRLWWSFLRMWPTKSVVWGFHGASFVGFMGDPWNMGQFQLHRVTESRRSPWGTSQPFVKNLSSSSLPSLKPRFRLIVNFLGSGWIPFPPVNFGFVSLFDCAILPTISPMVFGQRGGQCFR